MAVLIVKALTLEGAIYGIRYLFSPDWSHLGRALTWMDAYTHIVLNFKIGLGCFPALGSYNKVKHNTIRDVFITCLVSIVTNLLMGVLVFSLLGYMAEINELSISDVVTGGFPLAFSTFPELVIKRKNTL